MKQKLQIWLQNFLNGPRSITYTLWLFFTKTQASDKARGHIGTELMNKAETVIALQVDKYDESISTVSAGFCRNKSFKPFAFTITDDGSSKDTGGLRH